MNKKHRYVELSQISDGAILADDLLDKLGHVLLPAGTTLTTAMLKAIAHHDIHQLSLFSSDQETSQTAESEEDVAEKERQLERLKHIFRHSQQESVTEVLKTYLESYRRGDAS
jgi:urease accessory protein UreF